MKKSYKKRTIDMAQTAIVLAVLLIMAVTPLGYIMIFPAPPVGISFLLIPVALGAVLIGPAAGAILGAANGIQAIVKCFGVDPVGMIMLQVNAPLTVVTSLLPRILAGWLTGVIFSAFKKAGKTGISAYLVSSLAAPALNTVTFALTLWLFCSISPELAAFTTAASELTTAGFIAVAVGVNTLTETLISLLVTTPVAKAMSVATRRLIRY